MKADNIVEVARSAIGVPFKHQGRSINGLDCVGLIIYVTSILGIECTDIATYPRIASGRLLEDAFNSHVTSGILEKGSINELRVGDFLMMRFTGEPQHLAIYTGENLIHSYLQVGKVCEHLMDNTWKSRIVHVYRLAGLES